MPIMIYSFLTKALEAYGRPVTTRELRSFVYESLPMCADHVAPHLLVLLEHGLVTRRLDTAKKAVYWDAEKPYATPKELATKHPTLFEDSVYYYTVSQEMSGGEPFDMDKVIEYLYTISGGTPNKPSPRDVAKAMKKMKRRENPSP